jgi:transposase InsO family protein
MDTGATRSILPYVVYKEICPTIPLDKSSVKLKSYTNHPLKVAGKVVLPTTYKDKVEDIEYQVVHVNQCTLLSGDACSQLGMIERINIVDKYPELGKTTGTLPGTYKFVIDPSVPPVVHAPRRQPRALVDKIVKKLKEMESEGHITKVTEPTDWVNSMVAVLKGEQVRICVDPKDLNKAIRREHYPIPTVEEVVASMPPNAKVFSVIDAKSGFLQIKLDHKSSLLTTFNTPIGRFRWLRLPFGIKTAPEAFQRIMDTMLDGIDGARAIMDDILVAGTDEADHDRIMKQVVTRATEYNLKLNLSKCKVKATKVKYVGHTITASGLQPDENKVEAVKKMPCPKSKEDVRRFLGFIQYLAKFLPKLSEVDAPLRELLCKDTEFHWDKPQQTSFNKLKELCCRTPVLAYYDPKKATTIQCDASSYAVGGVLLQDGRPIAYTSRALSPAEQRYAQIEKETLAIVHCCKKFHYNIFGAQVLVESDHKPLQAIFNKPLLAAPMRLQSMLLRLQPYDLVVKYVPGKDIPLGDTLSRANLSTQEPDLEPETINMVEYISITPARYSQVKEATAAELNQLRDVILSGWPETKAEVHPDVREYWNFRDELAEHDGILWKGMRFIVPPSLRRHMLSQIHASHLGVVKCKRRAAEAMFWPGMHAQIEDLVMDCAECSKYQNRQAHEPLCPTRTPDLPWVEAAADLFDWEGRTYLLTIDYFSKFIEVDYLPNTESTAVISALKTQMCRHGVVEKLRTDNGPQFSSAAFQEFCKSYGISHVTSSPHYPQSNGEAERAVQTVKRLWAKSKDKNLALLDYRTTPLESCKLSPAQLCMSRRPRNLLPIARDLLLPKVIDIPTVRRKLDMEKEKQRYYYDRKAGPNLPMLQQGDPVLMSPLPGTKKWLPAKVIAKHSSPRSYIVEYKGRKYRRNRRDLRMSTFNAHEAANLQQPQKIYSRSTPMTETKVNDNNQQPVINPDQSIVPIPPSENHDNATGSKSPKSPSRQQAPTSATPSPHQPNLSAKNNSTAAKPSTPTYTTKFGRVVRKPKHLQYYSE